MSLISCTHLTNSFDNVDRTSYTTASVTLTAGKLHLVGVTVRKAAPTASPTLSGTGTWVELKNQISVVDTTRVCLFACIPSADATGAITIDFAGVTQQGCAWSVEKFDNTSTGATGAGGIVQTVSETRISAVTSIDTTLNTFGRTQNATYGYGTVQQNEVITAGAGFTVTGQDNGATPNLSHIGEFKNNNDTVVDFSWTTSNGNCAIVAAEIACSQYPKIVFT